MSPCLPCVLSFQDSCTVFSIPELNGRPLVKELPFVLVESGLDTENYEYTVYFQTDETGVFADFAVQKEGGESCLPRATSFYEDLLPQELGIIAQSVVSTTLGLNDCTFSFS